MSAKPDPVRTRALGRALLPELMATEDVALALCMGVRSARRYLRAGWLGPTIQLGRRVFLRREAFIAALKRAEVGS